MEKELILTGYKSGVGKSNKKYYMLTFITPPVLSQNKEYAYSNNVTVFTTEEKYNLFIKENSLLDTIYIPFEVNGDKVRYYL